MSNTAYTHKQDRIFKVLNFRLSHGFKKLGLIGAVLIFLVLIGYKFMGSNTLIVKDVLRTMILFFLLLASLSKDELEDEYNRHLRFQSFVIAFVIATVYSILIPLLAIVLDFAITNITGNGDVNFYKISAFEVLFILLGTQLLYFEALKRMGRV